MQVTMSEIFVLDLWYGWVQTLKARGFTPAQARAIASLKQAYYSGAVLP